VNDEKMAETLLYSRRNLEVFNENEFLETSNDLNDSEISLFIEENRNWNTTKKDKN